MGALVDIKVPDIGDFSDVEVIEVMVKPGDPVRVDDSLITIESDKASMEVPATQAGIVKEIRVKIGDKVSEGSPIVVIETAAAADGNPAAAAAPTPAAKPAPAPTLSVVKKPAPATAQPARQAKPPAAAEEAPTDSKNASSATAKSERSGPAAPESGSGTGAESERKPHASPAVRKFARELGVDLHAVKGSGLNGRIFRSDVQKFVKSAIAAPARATGTGVGAAFELAPWPKIDFAKFGEIETRPLSRIRRLSKANLARNWVMIPHVTQFDEADVTELEALRHELSETHAKDGVRITMLAFVLKALVRVLTEYPEFNSSLDGDNLILRKYFHFGFAADTPEGLLVPVVRDVDKKGVAQIARETAALAQAAREGKLKMTDIRGGCFTVSSLGGIGGTAFTPIINAPEVAILGLSRLARKPVWQGSAFVPRLMLPLSLAYDHRVIDGALAARFVTYLSAILSDMRRALL
ncbi:MAG TPA: dihydrolipoyllysine-residue acetyltransferase [Candidatus Binataceae bacterium]|jgi:pyruvate dehydrogenase E2 component (dihydrolipoamide acetyltransferase)|nr:dihydrolipoyllysine-residue acetyltransferase [Candidatus Binataceae bacterium]